MITASLATLLTAGTLGGALLGAFEVFMKIRRAKKIVDKLRSLEGIIETDFDKLSEEGKENARRTISGMNRINIDGKL